VVARGIVYNYTQFILSRLNEKLHALPIVDSMNYVTKRKHIPLPNLEDIYIKCRAHAFLILASDGIGTSHNYIYCMSLAVCWLRSLNYKILKALVV
jgi:hypothetical protein